MSFLQQSGWRDSNPHALRHQILSLACLPVPAHPGSQGFTLLNLGGAEWSWTTAYGFSVHCTITTYTTAPKFSSIIYCLLWACIISTSLNPYLHLALSFSRNYYQVPFRSIWSVGWIFPSLLCTGNGIRTHVTCLKGTSPGPLADIPAFIFYCKDNKNIWNIQIFFSIF